MRKTLLLAVGIAIATISPVEKCIAQEQLSFAIPVKPIQLVERNVPVYTLQEIAEAMCKQSGKDFYVDKRIAQKKLLVVSPDEKSLPLLTDLLDVMAAATHLKWRLVDNTYFLTLHDEDVLRDFNRKQQQEMAKLKSDIFASVQGHAKGKIPVDISVFKPSRRKWSDFNAGQQKSYGDLYSSSKEHGKSDQWQLDDLSGADVWFVFDFSVVLRDSGRSHTTGIAIIR